MSTTTLGLGKYPLGPETPLGGWGWLTTKTAQQTGVRVIDPVLGDYAQSGGTILRTTPVRQQVITALSSRIRTSLALRGIRLPEYISETSETDVRRDCQAALSDLTRSGTIELLAVRVIANADGVIGRLGIEVSYRDLISGAATPQVVRILSNG